MNTMEFIKAPKIKQNEQLTKGIKAISIELKNIRVFTSKQPFS
jgi:hypothetical protein